MAGPDRPTPVDAYRAAKPPRPAQAAPGSPSANPDAQRLAREAASAAAKQKPVPPPLPDRSRTPQSGGIDAQPPSLKDSQEALLRDELAKERSKVAQLERDARAAAEAKQVAYPPKVSERSPSPPAGTRISTPPDAAIGKSVRYLLGKLWPFFVAAAGIGGGVTAVAKPSADPVKQDATLANTEALRADVALIREQLTGVIKREASRDAYTKCLEESIDDVGEQVLPAQDRLGSAAPLRAYVKRCQRLRP